MSINPSQPININITSGTIIKAVVILAASFLIYLLLDMVLVILTAIVIASAIEPATLWFSKYKVPRVLAVLLIYGLSFIAIFGFLYMFIPPLFTDVTQLAVELPAKLENLDLFGGILEPVAGIGGLEFVFTFDDLLLQLRSLLASLSAGGLTTATTLFGGAFSFIIILVLSFYLAVQKNGIDNFLRLVTPIQHEKYVISVWRRSQTKIGQWMKGQLLLGLLVGVLVFLGLTILGVKYAFVLAVFAALLELIPVFGPVVSAIPAVVIGFTDSMTTGLLVLALYILIQQFENHLLYPLVVKKIIGMSPIVVIISLIVGWQLFGFLGIVLSVPIATVLMEIASDAEAKKAALMKQNEKKSTA